MSRLTPLDGWIARKIGCDPPLTHAALEAYQVAALNETLRWVKTRSAFYRARLVGVPDALDSLDDLRRLPFTTADDLRAHPAGFVCVSQDDVQRIVTLDSSGTTGSPKRVYFTADDQELTVDFFHYGMSTFTDPGDRVLILLPGATPGSVGDLLAAGLRRLGATPIPHGPVRDAAATLDVMRRERADVLVGVPTHVLALARQATDVPIRLKSVLLSTDHVPDAIRRAIETAFGCVVYNHYGMTEMGLGGGVECEARRGYHLREADLLFEVVDPTTGQVQPDGEPGEVVLTTLTRRGMPLVRYRTGDAGRFIPGVCPCGTALKTLEQITYRLDGRVTLGDDRLTMADLDEAVFAVDGVLNFAAEVSREGGRDMLTLRVKMVPDHDVGAVTMALSSVAPCAVRVIAVDTLPATMAKRAIVDKRVQMAFAVSPPVAQSPPATEKRPKAG